MEKLTNIIDLHTCIQGEGKFAGIPHILIRVSGCNLKCYFRGNICDTPYSSWFPENGKYTLSDLNNIFIDNPQISHTFITGGEPFLDPKSTKHYVDIAKKHGHFVAVETNGTLYEDIGFDFVTISPKLLSSVPIENITVNTVDGELYEITSKDVIKHNRNRIKRKALEQFITNTNYQFKFVLVDQKDLEEIQLLQEQLNIPNKNIYLMPEGLTNSDLQKNRSWVIDSCIKYGYNYSDRLHIVAFGEKRDA